MALGALFIGMFAHTPGLVKGLTLETSDRIIPLFFSTYSPLFGAIVVAAVIAAGISTILPAAQGFLVPVASLGYGIVMQLVPAALGTLY